MKMKIWIIAILAMVGLLGFSQQEDYKKYTPKLPIVKEYIVGNLTYLASDEVGGREAGTVGEVLASNFIANELNKYGVKPFGDDGTYFNNYKLAVTSPDPIASLQLLDSKGKVLGTYQQIENMLTSSRHTEALNAEAGLVFAGYGIDAPELNYNDYKNLDVKGKVVLVLDGDPSGADPRSPEGAKWAKYSRINEKIKTATDKGALTVISTNRFAKSFGWKRLAGFSARPSMGIYKPSTTVEKPYATVADTVMSDLLGGSKYSLADLQKKASAKENLPTFNLPNKVKINIPKPVVELKNSRNIVGIVEGTDPVLKNEYVAISAHYDHDGIKNGEVYNGADDDGSGTVCVMEVGRLVAKLHNNKRSVLIIFHAAEEKGLLGSQVLAENLSVKKDVVGLINMDMVGRESTDSIHVIGSDRLSTEYHNIIVETNKKTTNFVMDFKYNAKDDPNRFYFRSDHYNYAKQGIPVVFFFDDMRKDYHKASDEVQYINFDKIVKVTELSYSILDVVANLDHRLVVDGIVE